MTTKIIDNNIQNIIEGINKSSKVITSTMGGSGKNVILATKETMAFTKDGVSVANYLKLQDSVENVGSRLLIEAANKTVEQCGDGTTLTTLFTKELINFLKSEIDGGIDVNVVLENLDDFVVLYEKALLNSSNKVDTYDKVYKIAKTSCKSPVLAKLIKDIYEKTGYEAKISLEMSQASNETYYEIINGLNFESGMINSRFSNQDNDSCVLDNALLILENDTVSNPQNYIEIFDNIKNNDKAVVIIAPAFSDSFIRFALTNKSQVGLKICLIKCPGYGRGIEENYRDIIAFSNLDNTVDKIVITGYDFTIYNNTNDNKINKRISQLEKLADAAVESYFEEDYRLRINKLKQAGAIIYVGGNTEQEAKERFDRIEDAIGAVSTAIESGYVRGAGCELYNIANDLTSHPSNCSIILKKPLEQILKNANINKSNLKFEKPYNVILKDYDDSIIDPTNVLINSFKNAVSLVKLLINTSYIVYND